ncbi:hypothetical protein Goshw_001408, partial [Gossypium schwendimanii]|nr:hypothetical protein [Gossypium schwendimanii]
MCCDDESSSIRQTERLVGGIGMHSPYSASPTLNGRLVARNAITARFDYGSITSIGCNSHSPREASIRDSARVSYFLFHSLASSRNTGLVSILPSFRQYPMPSL